jgi:hypothetical protein
MRPLHLKYAALLVTAEVVALAVLQVSYGFLSSYGYQTLGMLLELATVGVGILFGILTAVFLSLRWWIFALAAIPLPCLVAGYVWIDRFDLIPQSIDLADDVRFEVAKNKYLGEVAAIPDQSGRRLLMWPWREFEFGSTQPWFVLLMYDESDEVARGQRERSLEWQDRIAVKDRLFAMCAQDVRHLRDHFYLVTLTC